MNQAVREAADRGYTVSPTGELLNAKKFVMSPKPGARTGYLRFIICLSDGRDADVQVHRLAAYLKFGEATFGADCVRHLNGNKLDNRPCNLALGTHTENMLDRAPEARLAHAQKAAAAQRRLSPESATALRADHAAGLTFKELAKKYEVSVGTAHSVVKKTHWSSNGV